jgi:hypothetical protein
VTEDSEADVIVSRDPGLVHDNAPDLVRQPVGEDHDRTIAALYRDIDFRVPTYVPRILGFGSAPSKECAQPSHWKWQVTFHKPDRNRTIEVASTRETLVAHFSLDTLICRVLHRVQGPS